MLAQSSPRQREPPESSLWGAVCNPLGALQCLLSDLPTLLPFFSFSFSSNDLYFIVLGGEHEKTEDLRILGEATAGGAWSWRLAVTA